MLKVSVSQTSSQVFPIRSAVLLYGNQGEKVQYASLHPVRQQEGSCTIGAGSPLDQEVIKSVLLDLSNVTLEDVFIPEHVLVKSPSMVMWWRRPQMTRLWFDTDAFNTDKSDKSQKFSVIVPLPGLVFFAGGDFRVWAVKGDARPERTSRLFRSPFLNVWEEGKICTGNVKLPTSFSGAATAQWEQAFFRSRFTHSNVDRPVKYKGGYRALWKDLFDQVLKTFPEDALIPETHTIESFVNARIGKK